MAYCVPGDLPIGKMPLPATINLDQKVQAAADEMDIYLGQRYATPVVLNQNDARQRPSSLMLKLTNANLAAGRILLEITSPVEDRSLHAYGASLVKDALAELCKIRDGQASLEGALPIDQRPTTEPTNAPRIYQKDLVSRVDAFYDAMMPGDRYGLSLLGAARVEQTPAYVLVQGSPGTQGAAGPVGPVGPQGVGLKGDKGDPGDTGTDVSMTFYQQTPAMVWTITHVFLRPPAVTIIGGDGVEITSNFTVTYPSSSTVTIQFLIPRSGMAVLT